jgi:hypothetical protein
MLIAKNENKSSSSDFVYYDENEFNFNVITSRPTKRPKRAPCFGAHRRELRALSHSMPTTKLI